MEAGLPEWYMLKQDRRLESDGFLFQASLGGGESGGGRNVSSKT